ncbi:hypothetical protein BC826DRAFT_1003528 [Russula brevipes]|nr:hypothetical protein BC826DRAFT_1003528 [Russula brevipes]
MTALDKIITSDASTSSSLALGRFSCFGKPEYLEEAIFRFRATLARYLLKILTVDTISRITKMADVEEAVKCYRLFLASLQPSPSPSDMITFIVTLLSRFSLFEDRKDFDELMHLYPIAATIHTRVPPSIQSSCQWAMTARIYKHPSTSTAYENAMSLMQDSLAFAPTLEIQHFRLGGACSGPRCVASALQLSNFVQSTCPWLKNSQLSIGTSRH